MQSKNEYNRSTNALKIFFIECRELLTRQPFLILFYFLLFVIKILSIQLGIRYATLNSAVDENRLKTIEEIFLIQESA